jgi:3',5'-cyclic AMP phosphodiesterase CpdA
LDTERIDSAQLEWLEQDLAKSSARFSIVFGHRPPFSSGKHGPDTTVRDEIVPIVERHGVDLFLSGHEHHYERIRTRGETHYIISGGGGRTSRPPTPNADTAFAEEVLHFVLVELEADSLLLHAIDATGQEFDSLLIR